MPTVRFPRSPVTSGVIVRVEQQFADGAAVLHAPEDLAGDRPVDLAQDVGGYFRGRPVQNGRHPVYVDQPRYLRGILDIEVFDDLGDRFGEKRTEQRLLDRFAQFRIDVRLVRRA